MKFLPNMTNEIVWACAYHRNDRLNDVSMALKQKPIPGMIVKARYSYVSNIKTTDDLPPAEPLPKHLSYGTYAFVPFRKNSTTQFATSKALDATNRRYAATEDECIQLYNSLVDNVIGTLQEQIDLCKSDKIPM